MNKPLENVIDVFRLLTAAGFVLASLASLMKWRRVRDRPRANITLALGSLALVSVLGEVGLHTGYRYPILGDISIVLFAASGYYLMLFRGAFVPLSRAIRVAAGLAALGATVFVLAVRIPYEQEAVLHGADRTAVLVLVVVWAVLVGEPAFRFWRQSKGRPAVQRARLRSLSFAYVTIVFVLLVAVLADAASRPALTLAIQIIAFLLVGSIYASLSPPGWLRRAWREREEEELRSSEELIMFADNRVVLAERALDWAMRLIGADGAFVVDADGRLLAARNFDEETAHALAARAHRVSLFPLETSKDLVIVAEMPTGRGVGSIGVRSGPFTLLFGSDEQERLARHATLSGVALDRVRVTEELRSLDAARREFISNAAHELRTPLTAILGLASLLETKLSTFSLSEQTEMISAVHRQARRMRSLVNNLLDLSQIEQGKITVSMGIVPLRTSIDSVVATTPAPSDGRVVIQVDPDVRVRADAVRLEQIITNLLTNAFRYGGNEVAISSSNGNGEVLVAVEDDGPGVAADVLPHLFEPFARSRTVTATEGYGLGLAIVKGLAQALGGDIWYEGSDGRGARFVLRLQEAA